MEFDPDRLDQVVAVMDAMAAAGTGWVNFEPSVDPEDLSGVGAGFFGLFSGRGPEVALATWTPPTVSRRGRAEPAMIGLQHGAGRRVKPLLAVPDGWLVTQDYVKKGLVIALPAGVDHAEVLRWLLEAAQATSPVPVGPMWRASVYGG